MYSRSLYGPDHRRLKARKFLILQSVQIPSHGRTDLTLFQTLPAIYAPMLPPTPPFLKPILRPVRSLGKVRELQPIVQELKCNAMQRSAFEQCSPDLIRVNDDIQLPPIDDLLSTTSPRHISHSRRTRYLLHTTFAVPPSVHPRSFAQSPLRILRRWGFKGPAPNRCASRKRFLWNSPFIFM